MNASRSRAGGRFGPYELRSLLGRGGMGEVYEAYDTHNDRVVALKLLPEELAQDPTYRKRFQRESHAATRIDDPHIVPVNRAGEIDGVLYLDMRLIRGDNLRSMLRRLGPIEPERAVHIIEQVASALDAAHLAGLVHRDVKPANILVTPTDFTFLTDFGIARTEGDSSTTMVGITAGSYTYMAPERFDSGPITGRADIYSLACVLYECLTGTTPFPVQNISNLIRSHLSESPPRPSLQRPDVPAALDAVIAHAMSKNPADRFAAAGEFAGAAHAAVGLSERADAEPPARGAELPTAGGSPFGLDPEPDREDIAATSQRLAAGPGAPRPVAEPNTFQPFGPQGPTIAAQFQPRGGAPEPRPEATGGVPPATGSQTTIMRTPATGDSTTTLVPRGPVPPVADDDIPAEPAPAPRGYETTGSLRIIAPPDPAQRDPDADLPVITPADPTRVRREEFELSPLPQRTPTGSLNLPPQAPVSQDAPRTELLPHGTTPGDRGGYADEPSRNIGYAQEHGGYDHDPYGEYAQPAAYSGYGSGDYDENGYDHGRYDEQAGYADERYHENYSEGYDYGRENYGSEDYGAGEYDDEQAAPKKRSIAMPIVFGVLGVALAAGAAVIGWQVLGKSGATSTAAARPSSPAAAAVDPATPDTSTAPDTTTAAAVSTPPAGSTACRPTSSTAGSPYTRSASGNSDTGCGFAEAVRKAYARAAAKDAESGSDAPSSVVAVSPATGRSYTMSCQATGRLITCTGGDDAVVYVY